MRYPIVVANDRLTSGEPCWTAWLADHPGIYGWGDTPDEAKDRLWCAQAAYLRMLADRGEAPPPVPAVYAEWMVVFADGPAVAA